ncbi:MAG TPA: hypothetical protein VIK14_00690 [Ignavibacteria bacterium]
MAKQDKIDYEKLADELIEWFKVEENIYLKNFAIQKGFPARKISEYANKNKYFEEKLALAKDIQESRLVNKMIGNNPSPPFIIFLLKNIAGWRDRFADEKGEKNIPTIKLVLTELKPKKNNCKRKENKDQLNLFDDDENSE